MNIEILMLRKTRSFIIIYLVLLCAAHAYQGGYRLDGNSVRYVEYELLQINDLGAFGMLSLQLKPEGSKGRGFSDYWDLSLFGSSFHMINQYNHQWFTPDGRSLIFKEMFEDGERSGIYSDRLNSWMAKIDGEIVSIKKKNGSMELIYREGRLDRIVDEEKNVDFSFIYRNAFPYIIYSNNTREKVMTLNFSDSSCEINFGSTKHEIRLKNYKFRNNGNRNIDVLLPVGLERDNKTILQFNNSLIDQDSLVIVKTKVSNGDVVLWSPRYRYILSFNGLSVDSSIMNDGEVQTRGINFSDAGYYYSDQNGKIRREYSDGKVVEKLLIQSPGKRYGQVRKEIIRSVEGLITSKFYSYDQLGNVKLVGTKMEDEVVYFQSDDQKAESGGSVSRVFSYMRSDGDIPYQTWFEVNPALSVYKEKVIGGTKVIYRYSESVQNEYFVNDFGSIKYYGNK